jgi:tetratricopeptide (TPR) repeat protein
VLAFNPDDAQAYYNRATCKSELDDFGAGVSDMDEAIRVDSKNAAYYKQRGNFYYQLKNKEKACFDWRRAVEFGDTKARFQIDQYCK